MTYAASANRQGRRALKSIIFLTLILLLSWKGVGQNYSLVLDGTNDNVQFGNFGSLSAFTIEGWFYWQGGDANNDRILGAEGGSVSIEINGSNGGIHVIFNDFSPAYGRVSSTTTGIFEANTWVHFALVYNGGTTIDIYKNGGFVESLAGVPAASVVANHTTWYLGADGDGTPSECINAIVDEFRIWNVDRSSFLPTQYDFALGNPQNETGLLVYYDFEEASGFTLNDLATGAGQGGDNFGLIKDGNVDHGTPGWQNTEGAPIVSGNSALTFDGSTNYVDLFEDELFTGDFTIEVWVNISNLSNYSPIISKQATTDNNTAEFNLQVQGPINGNVNFFLGNGSGYSDVSGNNANDQDINLNTWTHIAAVVEGTNMLLYINGQLSGTSTFTGTRQNSSSPVQIGRYENAQLQFWPGQLDEVRIWNTARNASDIAANANNELNGNEAGLVAYYDFVDGSGLTVTDAAATNDGTINGGATWTTTGPTIDPAPAVNLYDLQITPSTNQAEAILTLDVPTELFYVITTSPTQPTADQIISGQDHSGAAAYNYDSYGSYSNEPVSVGTSEHNNGSDLVASTTYYIYWVADADASTATTNDRSVILSDEFTTTTPADLTFTTLSIPSADLAPGSTDNLIYGWQMDVATASVESQGYLFDFTGTFDSADFALDGFQLWENTTNDFGTATPVGTPSSIDTANNPGGAMVALLYNQTHNTASTTYFWVTADMASGATPGNTFSVVEPETSAFNTFNFTAGFNYTGTGVTAGSTMTVGPPSPALDFDGTNDYVSLPTLDLSAGDAMTIEAWIRPDVLTGYHEITRQNGSGNPDWLLSFQPGINLTFGLYTASGFYQTAVATSVDVASLTNGSWHHVAAVYDGSDMYLYLDGTQVATRAKTGTPGTGSSTTNFIGTFNGGGEFFDGGIDEVRFWNDARSVAELNANRDVALNGSEPGLVAYYDFSDATGTTLTDLTNGFDGTLTNFALSGTSSNWIVSGPTLGDPLVPVPTITGFTPSSGPSATTVTITGTDFDPTFANNIIFLDGVSVNPTGGNATSLTFDIPAQIASVTEISVLNSTTGTMSNASHALSGATDRHYITTNGTPYFPYFGTKADYFTGSSQSPRDIITGDFNLDGVLDLATLNSQFGNISVALGVGDGTFNTPVNHSISGASNTFNMDMGDFNGDGFIDIVASGSNPSPALHIMLGDGIGGFSSPTTSSFALNSGAGDIAVADFNNDGFLDVVASYIVTQTSVSVLLGTGTGEFETAVDYSIGVSEHAVATGDFNNDGLADIAVLDDTNHDLNILLNNGSGGFNAPVNYSCSFGSNPLDNIVVGDFNEDGNLDIIGSRIFTLEIFTGAGDGSFANSTYNFPDSFQPRYFDVGDFNGDGYLDIAASRADASTEIRIYTGDGAMNFSLDATVTADDQAERTTNGDFNGDGRMDLAVAAGGTAENINVFISEPVPAPSAPVSLIAFSSDGTNITLDWDPTGVDFEDGFKVYRSADYGFTAEEEVTGLSLGADATTTTFVEDNTKPFYRVAAFNASGETRTTSEFATTEVFPGQALSFDGNDDYIQVDAPSFLPNEEVDDYTMEAWIYPTDLSSFQSILTITGDEAGSIEPTTAVSILANGDLEWLVRSSENATPFVQISSTGLQLNTWHHIAASKIGPDYRLYIDGVEVASALGTSVFNADNDYADRDKYLIGTGWNVNAIQTDTQFQGEIDEVRIWNSGKSDFSDRYNSLAGNEANLVAYYPFDENIGATTVDGSQSTNDATISGATFVASTAGAPIVYNATQVSTSGFLPNIELPTGAIDIIVDVSTDPNFGSFEVQNQSIGTSGAITISTSLATNTQYFYRAKVDYGSGIVSPYGVSNAFMVTPGNALAFDGGDDYVTASNPNLSPPMSVEFWVKLNSTNTASQILTQFGGGGIYIGRYTQGRVLAFFDGSSSNNSAADESTLNLLDDQWHHIAATTDGTTTRLYIDGALEVSHSETATAGVSALYLGANQGTAAYMNGSLDEIRIWDDERTLTEITDNRYNTITGSEAGLVAYYRFDENTGTTLPDLAGTNDGTLINMAGTEWTTSGAMTPEAPVISNAYNVTTTSIDVDFTVPTGATDILIDIDDDPAFGSPGATNISVGTSGTFNVSGQSFTAGIPYYFRARALYAGGTSDNVVSNSFMVTPGNALAFDGVDDYLAVSATSPAAYTIEAWVKFDALSGNMTISRWTQSGDPNQASHWLKLDASGAYFEHYVFDGGVKQVIGTTPVNTGQWYHIAISAQDGGSMRLYVNGVEEGTALTVGTQASVDQLRIGDRPGAHPFLDGQVDEFRYWNDIRTSTEIQNNQFKVLTGAEAGLITYYRFDETTGTTLPDLAGNNDGTWNGATSGVTTPQWTTSGAMAPTVYQATGVSTTQFTANWEPISFADQINIQYSSDGFSSDINTVNVTGGAETGTTYDVTGLTLTTGTPYEYRVAVVEAGNTSPYSAPVEFMITPGNALTFNGVNDYIAVGPIAELQSTANFSFETWFRLESYNQVVFLGNPLAGYSGGPNRLSIATSNPGRAGYEDFEIWLENGGGTYANTNEDLIKLNTWYHLAVTYDGAGVANADKLKLYLNGEEKTLTFPGGTLPSTTSAVTRPFAISANGGGDGNYIDGQLDEMRLWANTLSISDIQSRQFTTISGAEANLITYYRFDETTGTTLPDLVGTYDGTLTNMDGSEWTTSEAMAPTVYQATGITTTHFTANWEAVSFADQIDIQYSSDGFSSDINTVNVTGGAETGSTYDVTGLTLTAGTKYAYRVAVVEAGNTSPYSAPVEFMVSPGNALDFDGTDDYVVIPPSSSTLNLSNYTITAWIYGPSLSSNYQPIFMKQSGSAADIEIYGGNGGITHIHNRGNGGTQSVHYATATALPSNTWVHYAATYDGADLKIYVNGSLSETVAMNTLTNNPYPIDLGRSTSFATHYFEGQMDEFSLWTTALDETAIGDIRDNGLVGDETNLEVYYNFDDGIPAGSNAGITNLPDLSANANDGTLNGFALNGTTSNWVASGALADVVAPVFEVAPTVSTVQANDLEINVQLNEGSSQVAYSILQAPSLQPSLDDIGTSAGDVFGVITVTDASSNYLQKVEGLIPSTNYDVYLLPYDAQSNRPGNPTVISTTTASEPENAIDLNGSTDFVSFATQYAGVFNGADKQFTIEGWIYPRASKEAILFSKSSSSGANNEMVLQLTGADVLRFTYYGQGDISQYQQLQSVESVSLNTWNHVAITYDGTIDSNGEDRVKFYINGADAGMSVFDVAGTFPFDIYTGTAHTGIGTSLTPTGTNSVSSASMFNGLMDNIRVWTDVRDQNEIAGNAYSTSPAGDALLSQYWFNSSSGDPREFVSSFDGSLEGTPGYVVSTALDADIFAPYFTNLTAADNYADAVDVNYTINEAADLYWLALETGGQAPLVSEVLAGSYGGSGTLASTGSVMGVTSGTANVTGLSDLQTYDIYFVTEDAQGNASSTQLVTHSTTAPPASITVVQPNGGETLTEGVAYDITWGYSGFPDTETIEIRLSTDNGSSWGIINDGSFATFPTNTYSWTPNSGQVSSQALIEVANTTSAVSDQSNATFTVEAAAAPKIIYVRAGGGGPYNGTSWASAYQDLQPALDNANAGDTIVVATGTYTPSVSVALNGTGNEQTYLIPDGVNLFGGFSGVEDVTLQASYDTRDFVTNQTILSGDLNGDDTAPTINIAVQPLTIDFGANRADNVLHVVSVQDATVLIDGFTIQGAHSANNQYGGGIYVDATVAGYTDVTVNNSLIRWNRADRGAAIGGNENDTDAIINVKVFNTTISQNSGWNYGAYHFQTGGNAQVNSYIYNSIFSVNRTDFDGAAILVLTPSSSLEVVNSLFFENDANRTSGGLVVNANTFSMTNATLAHNYGNNSRSGGLSIEGGSNNVVRNTIIYGNQINTVNDYQVFVGAGATLDIDYSLVQDGATKINNAGTQNFATGTNLTEDPLFLDSAGFDFALQAGSPAIDAGTASALPVDGYDLDNDENFSEFLPIDLGGLQREQGTVDIGAYETTVAISQTVQTGNWSDPATWGGSTPIQISNVEILHDVTVDLAEVAVNDFTLSAGTFDLNGNTLLVSGKFEKKSSPSFPTFTHNNGRTVLNGEDQTYKHVGDITHGSLIFAGTGTVTLDFFSNNVLFVADTIRIESGLDVQFTDNSDLILTEDAIFENYGNVISTNKWSLTSDGTEHTIYGGDFYSFSYQSASTVTLLSDFSYDNEFTTGEYGSIFYLDTYSLNIGEYFTFSSADSLGFELGAQLVVDANVESFDAVDVPLPTMNMNTSGYFYADGPMTFAANQFLILDNGDLDFYGGSFDGSGGIVINGGTFTMYQNSLTLNNGSQIIIDGGSLDIAGWDSVEGSPAFISADEGSFSITQNSGSINLDYVQINGLGSTGLALSAGEVNLNKVAFGAGTGTSYLTFVGNVGEQTFNDMFFSSGPAYNVFISDGVEQVVNLPAASGPFSGADYHYTGDLGTINWDGGSGGEGGVSYYEDFDSNYIGDIEVDISGDFEFTEGTWTFNDAQVTNTETLVTGGSGNAVRFTTVPSNISSFEVTGIEAIEFDYRSETGSEASFNFEFSDGGLPTMVPLSVTSTTYETYHYDFEEPFTGTLAITYFGSDGLLIDNFNIIAAQEETGNTVESFETLSETPYNGSVTLPTGDWELLFANGTTSTVFEGTFAIELNYVNSGSMMTPEFDGETSLTFWYHTFGTEFTIYEIVDGGAPAEVATIYEEQGEWTQYSYEPNYPGSTVKLSLVIDDFNSVDNLFLDEFTFNTGMEESNGVTEDFGSLDLTTYFGSVSLPTGNWFILAGDGIDGPTRSAPTAVALSYFASGELITPPVEGSSAYSFYYASANGDPVQFQILENIDGGGFFPAAPPESTMSTEFLEYTGTVSSGTEVEIKIVVDDGSSGTDLIIDDFTLTPVGGTLPSISDLSVTPDQTYIDIDFEVNVTSDIYFVVTQSATAPSVSQIVAETDESDVQAASSGIISEVTGSNNSGLGSEVWGANDQPFIDDNTYYLYMVASSSEEYSDVVSTAFTTTKANSGNDEVFESFNDFSGTANTLLNENVSFGTESFYLSNVKVIDEPTLVNGGTGFALELSDGGDYFITNELFDVSKVGFRYRSNSGDQVYVVISTSTDGVTYSPVFTSNTTSTVYQHKSYNFETEFSGFIKIEVEQSGSGTILVEDFYYEVPATPSATITINSESVGGGTLLAGSSDNLIYKLIFDVADASTTTQGFFLSPNDSIDYTQDDFETFNFYESVNADDFGSATLIGSGGFFFSHPTGADDGSIGVLYSSTYEAGDQVFIYVTADMAETISESGTFYIEAPGFDSNFGLGGDNVEGNIEMGDTFILSNEEVEEPTLTIEDFESTAMDNYDGIVEFSSGTWEFTDAYVTSGMAYDGSAQSLGLQFSANGSTVGPVADGGFDVEFFYAANGPNSTFFIETSADGMTYERYDTLTATSTEFTPAKVENVGVPGDPLYVKIISGQTGSTNNLFIDNWTFVPYEGTDVTAPTITGLGTVSVSENTTGVGSYDAGEPVTWTLSGDDASLFTIGTDGTLTFTVAPDFESPSDANTDNIYDLVLEATDSVNNVGTLAVSVTVTDENDNAPTVVDPGIVTITEHLALGSTIVDLDFIDLDTTSASHIWTLGTGNTNVDGDSFGPFTIEATQGIIIVNDADDLDFESNTTFTLQVGIEDGVSITYTEVTIQLSDENDNTPVITDPGVVAIDENSSVGTEVVILSYSDADTTSTTYSWSIVAGNTDVDADSNLPFTIDNSGVLAINDSSDIDFELNASFTLSIRLTDGLNADTLEIQVDINDVTEDVTAPTITGLETVSVSENTTGVSTNDAGEPVTWTLSGDDASLFTIGTDGTLTFTVAPDFESPSDANTDNIYELVLEATDSVNNVGTLTVSVTVTDENDNTPVITDPGVVAIDENSPVGTEVVILSYSDADTTSTTYSWSIVAGNTDVNGDSNLPFAIDNSGVLAINDSSDIDFELNASFTLSIRLTDGLNADTLEIQVDINDLTEDVTAPTITGLETVSVSENTTGVSTNDAGEPVTWTLSGDDASLFTIGTDGTLIFTVAPDFESPSDANTDNIYELVLEATDSVNNVGTLTVSVTVTDENDNTPVITDPGALALDENSPEGTEVVSIAYSDADTTSTTYSWSIVAGNTDVNGDSNLPFAIDNSGVLAINDSSDIDFELNASFTLSIRLTDGLNADTLEIQVDINDLTEDVTAPTITGLETVSVSENTTGVGSYDAGEPVTWTLSGDDATLFTIGTDGTLTFTVAPDFESPSDANTDNIYELVLEATDSVNNVGTLAVSVTVTDENDNTPVITDPGVVAIDENSPVGTEVVILSYSDADTTSTTYSWSIVAGNTDVDADSNLPFAIDNSGVLAINDSSDIDFELNASFTLSIRLTDGLNADTLEIQVDINDLVEDTTAPVITAQDLITNDPSPELTGTVDDADATVTVGVDGSTYTGMNNGDGSWTLAQGTIGDLSEGIYTIEAIATDLAGNADTVTASLTIDLTTPVVTVATLETLQDSPALSGTVDDITASLEVSVDGGTYTATNTGAGSWTLASGSIASLAVGTYDVVVTATDVAGNAGTDASSEELTILPGAPTAQAASEVDYFSFTANWNVRAGIESYELDVARDPSYIDLVESFTGLTTNNQDISDLDYGRTYYYRVRAVYPSGDVSPSSSTITVSTLLDPNTVADSTALMMIYTALNGTEWTDNNWESGVRLPEWSGVTMSGTRVMEVDLSETNLSGAFPTLSEGLDALTTLDLSDNELTSLPGLANLTSLTSLTVTGNRLEFGSLEPNSTVSNFSYLPQDSVGMYIETLEQQGTDYEIDRTISGSSNSYSWFKEDLTSGEVTALSETGSSFSLSISDFTDEGAYYAEVTSTLVAGTLTTQPIVLKVSSLERDFAALTNIYNKMNGSSWSGNASNWLDEGDFEDWHGVTIESERVTELILPEANMTGSLPRDILDIQGLIEIDLQDNRISSVPDFSGLPNLDELNLSGNNLEFDDLEKNMDLSASTFDYGSQRLVGAVGVRDTIPVGSSYVVKAVVGGTANVYSWTLENPLDTGVLSNTSSTIDISPLSYENMGRYRASVTSTLVPNLTLTVRSTVVMATADLEFAALDLNGDPFIDGESYALRTTTTGLGYDTIQTVQGSGTGFFFDDLLLADYLIAVAPNDLEEFLPTYYANTDLWTEADTLELREDFSEQLRMAQIPPPPSDPEGAEISGEVTAVDLEKEGDDGTRINARRKVKRAGCSVRRFVPRGRTDQEEGDYVLYAYVQSDDEGRFEFTGLEEGKYRFNIEYPGIPMDPDSYVEFTIGEGGIEDEVLVLEAEVTEDGIVVQKIERLGFYRKYFKDLSVYPNPANDYLQVSYSKLMSSSVEVRLIDLEGQIVSSQLIEKGYDKDLTIDVSGVSGGIYLLNFIDTSLGAERITTFKVYVKHDR